ncbi:hypothetical protein [Phenylobacterium sp.]|uniref:hypothetical protein n=1 Tax=Phenylobacterium sp. TaxID=1871053 RepID=UPI0025E63936|nr:hypothetical protein [Phenylobacterium sp.]
MTQTGAVAELAGEFRTPRNAFQQAPGSIHNDAVASKLGFKGGTVPGSVHMDQFVPMLLDLYGPRWFETGDISLYFTQATVDAEPVRAVVTPGEGRARLTMYNEAGALICRGTASVQAPDSLSELSLVLQQQTAVDPTKLRILGQYRVGDELSGIPLRLEVEKLQDALTRITEPHPLYAQQHVLPPSHVVSLSHQVRPKALEKVGKSVGLFGALEVRQYRGPLRAGVDYVARTKMLKFTESPKAEAVWYDVVIGDPATGHDIACVQYFLRFMKASSPLWAAEFG